ncbi:MAG: SUMF1/EgtB/PvdO family nonheme iron enzyme [Candidatus Aminicenantes bacterium]|nr:MAG: SUMF1/EgtB/PvdO family nonheme iron enzyme [Candidatus Aminicenantes bacterium]
MTHLHKCSVIKPMVLFLVFLFFCSDRWLFSQAPPGSQIEGLFRWAVKDYRAGKYNKVVKDLQSLLSFYEEAPRPDVPQDKQLKGKIYLLLGAAYERSGHLREARENYQLSAGILPQKDGVIEGIDFTYLKEYQRIVMNKQTPVDQGIIEKPALKSKKKRISPLLVIAGTAVVGGIVTLALMKKKLPPEEIVPHFDTRVLGIQWMEISAGEFLMGDNFNEGDPDEQPVHAVYLDRYYISRNEVTFAQYARFCEETERRVPSDEGWGRGDMPVINVGWGNAKAFCDWLSEKTGKSIHLPTEAQWEKAARGTDQRRYPWGNSPPDCNKTNHNCSDRTQIVGMHLLGASHYWIQDMAGNAAEWCRDVYAPDYYSSSPYENPFNRSPVSYDQGTIHVVRGGSWDGGHELTIRSADRWYNSDYWIRPIIGFRLVWEPR